MAYISRLSGKGCLEWRTVIGQESVCLVCKDCGFLKVILTSHQGMPYILSLSVLWSLLSLKTATEQQVQKSDRQMGVRGAGAIPGSLAL